MRIRGVKRPTAPDPRCGGPGGIVPIPRAATTVSLYGCTWTAGSFFGNFRTPAAPETLHDSGLTASWRAPQRSGRSASSSSDGCALSADTLRNVSTYARMFSVVRNIRRPAFAAPPLPGANHWQRPGFSNSLILLMLRDQHSADMLLSPFARQIFLPLALPIARALLISTFAMAGRATSTVLEEWR